MLMLLSVLSSPINFDAKSERWQSSLASHICLLQLLFSSHVWKTHLPVSTAFTTFHVVAIPFKTSSFVCYVSNVYRQLINNSLCLGSAKGRKSIASGKCWTRYGSFYKTMREKGANKFTIVTDHCHSPPPPTKYILDYNKHTCVGQ